MYVIYLFLRLAVDLARRAALEEPMTGVGRIRSEHGQMRRLLGVLSREAARLGRSEDADLALMVEVLRYLTEFPDRYHHPVEDLALWRLAQRGLLGRAAAETLDFEHRSVRFHGARLLQLLEGVLVDGPTPREWVAMTAAQYAGELHAHMKHEEQALLPLLERHFGPQDWEEIAQLAAPPPDPLFGEHAALRFVHLRASIAERARCGCTPDPADTPRAAAAF
jgi:hemerythrin-like domain-containing protein